MIREEVDEKDRSDLYQALKEFKRTIVKCFSKDIFFIEKPVTKEVCGKPILFKTFSGK